MVVPMRVFQTVGMAVEVRVPEMALCASIRAAVNFAPACCGNPRPEAGQGQRGGDVDKMGVTRRRTRPPCRVNGTQSQGRAYVAVFGYQTFPAFTSKRISQSYVFHPLYGWDYSSFQLK